MVNLEKDRMSPAFYIPGLRCPGLTFYEGDPIEVVPPLSLCLPTRGVRTGTKKTDGNSVRFHLRHQRKATAAAARTRAITMAVMALSEDDPTRS